MIVGGGINGVMAAYFLLALKKKMDCKDVRVVLVESDKIANAASGNAGGFLAKDWHLVGDSESIVKTVVENNYWAFKIFKRNIFIG